MAMVNVRAMALEQFGTLKDIYAYYSNVHEKLCLVPRPDPDSKGIPHDEKLGIEYVDRIHAPIPDTLTEYLDAVEKALVQSMQQVFEDTKAEIQDALDADWQRVKDIVD